MQGLIIHEIRWTAPGVATVDFEIDSHSWLIRKLLVKSVFRALGWKCLLPVYWLAWWRVLNA